MDEILQIVDLKIDTGTHQVWRGEKEIYLSKREYQLLMEFIKTPRHVLDKKTLYEAVWQKKYTSTSSNVVEVYVNYLRNKLENHSMGKLIFTVHGYGYVLR